MPTPRIAPRLLSKQNTATSTNISRPARYSFVDRGVARLTCDTAYPGPQRKRNNVGVPCTSRLCSRWGQSSIQVGTDSIWIMSSDDTYSSFLDQANQDTGASKVSTKSNTATTKAVDTDVPVELQNVDRYYTSETDEPFEQVSLQWNGNKMPSEGPLNVC